MYLWQYGKIVSKNTTFIVFVFHEPFVVFKIFNHKYEQSNSN